MFCSTCAYVHACTWRTHAHMHTVQLVGTNGSHHVTSILVLAIPGRHFQIQERSQIREPFPN
jgi:hypothetical protein